MSKHQPNQRSKRHFPPIGDPNDPRGFWYLLQQNVVWLRVHNYSEATIASRERYVRMFLVWAADRELRYPTQVTKPILESFQRHLFHHRKANGQPLAWSSQISHLRVVRLFFEFLARENHIPFNPAASLQLPKQPQTLPKAVLTVEEAELIMQQPDISTPAGLRDRAILETFYSTGIRRMEVVNLNLEHVDAHRRIVMVRQGKGQKDRFVPIGLRALLWIARYVEHAREKLLLDPKEPALFVTIHGRRLDPDSLTEYVRRYIETSGVGKPGSCHLFRHSMATLMLENGADIRFIQAMLGHANLNTTQIYTRTSLKKLLEVHRKTHPAEQDDEPSDDRGSTGE
jgi:integrase/recombinase XerD